MDLSRATAIPSLSAAFMVVMGVGFLTAPDARFSSPAFRPALALADESAWGALILAAGLVLVVGIVGRHHRLRIVGYSVAAVWSLFFAFTLAWAVAQDDRVAFTGAVVYAFVGALMLTLARTARQR